MVREQQIQPVRCEYQEGRKWYNSPGENEFVNRTERVWVPLLSLEEDDMDDMPFKRMILIATLKIDCRIVRVRIYLFVCGIKYWKNRETIKVKYTQLMDDSVNLKSMKECLGN